MLKIYDYKGFPNPTRVRIALAEKELSDEVEFISIDVPAGEHRLPAFANKNPTATVPVLEIEDGTCISECTAITEYLDNLVGEPVLTGKSAKDRAIIHMMQRRAETSLLDAAATYFHHATPGLGPKIEIYQNREWGEKIASGPSPACATSTRCWRGSHFWRATASQWSTSQHLLVSYMQTSEKSKFLPSSII